MIRRPPRSTRVRSSAASDVYKRQEQRHVVAARREKIGQFRAKPARGKVRELSLIHISEPTRLLSISYAVFCLKKKNKIYYNRNKKKNTLYEKDQKRN